MEKVLAAILDTTKKVPGKGFSTLCGAAFSVFFALFGNFLAAHFTEAVLIKKTCIFHRF
jgi:hypothetical protein